MKIAHISPSYYPAIRFGGPIQSVHELNKALVHLGAEVQVVTTVAGQDHPLFMRPGIKTVDSVSVHFVDSIGYEHFNFSWGIWRACMHAISSADVVHITSVWNFPVLVAALLCKYYGKPYLLSPRGTLYPETISLGRSWAKRLYYLLVAQWIVKGAARIHYTTVHEQRKVHAYLGIHTPYKVVPNGLDMSQIPTDFTKRSLPYVLFLGRIDYKKGIDLAIKAFAAVRDMFPELQFYIVGPPSEYQSVLEQLVSDLHVKGRVHFEGAVAGTAKWDWYKGAKAMLLTSRSENFGMTVIEALSVDCPVLISNEVALSEELHQLDRVKVCSLELESITRHLEILLRETPSASSSDYIRSRYHTDTTAQSMLHVYQSMI